jgi:hypothetical protein
VQAEATIASEFATKLSSARSIPEATTVYQEWAGRRMEMATEDAKPSSRIVRNSCGAVTAHAFCPADISRSNTG